MHVDAVCVVEFFNKFRVCYSHLKKVDFIDYGETTDDGAHAITFPQQYEILRSSKNK